MMVVKKPVLRVWRLLAAGFAIATLSIAPTLINATSAQAAPVLGFNAGNIISDNLFYDGNAMTATEVQAFLNQRLSSCLIGTPPYMPGSLSPSGSGNTIANACIKDYRQTTSSRVADAYCSGYVGAANETAAQIIAKVGKACGISQKVLLVMLEKEQGLLTDSWPVTRQYNYAMGFACPDTPQGCDASSAGFALQLYLGARQFKIYKALPNNFNYKPFQNNTILWNPNRACGNSTVYLENWATAGLYIYTPYRPNQAALNAGWGTGDSCSSYGNRNFYNYYATWFGSPKYVLGGQFESLYSSLGGSYGELVGGTVRVADGLKQELERGTMYWSNTTGASVVNGGIRASYNSRGGAEGNLGFPIGREIVDDLGVYQQFSRGNLYWRGTGAIAVSTGIRSYFLASGGTSKFGYPTSEEIVFSGPWVIQHFDQGSITWSPSANAKTIGENIREGYQAFGGEDIVGFATTEAAPYLDGSWQGFRTLDIHWTNGIGTVPVFAGIRSVLNKNGGVSALGLAVSAEHEVFPGVVLQEFETSDIYWTPGNGTALLAKPISAEYQLKGIEAFGYPKGNTVRLNDGLLQEFTYGALYYSADTGSNLLLAGIRSAFNRYGGLTVLGYPTSGEYVFTEGSVRQDFENASIFWTPTTKGAVVSGAVLDYYLDEGSAKLGFPLNLATAEAGGIRQEFTAGTVYYSSATGGNLVAGGIRSTYLRLGGSASLGFPTTAEIVQPDGSVIQRFQRGTLLWTQATGARLV